MSSRHIFPVLGCLLPIALCGQSAPAPSNPTYAIRGVVVRHGTNQPLAHVLVTINRNGQPDQELSLKTAEDGRFTFGNVPHGKYTLSAEFRGLSKTFQQDEDGQYSTGIAVRPLTDSEHIVFPFPAATSLSVKVSDVDGDPVQRAQIFLFRKGVVSGWPKAARAGVAALTSSGLHRFGHLEPGTYLVAVEASPWFAQNGFAQNGPANQLPDQPPAASSDLDVAYPLTYYGGTSDPAAATPITIAEGEAAKIQITLTSVKAAHVDLGEESPEADGSQGGGSQVMATVFAEGPDGLPFNVYSASMVTNDKRREVTGLAPGHYIFVLTKFTPGQTEGGAERIGRTEVDVTGDMALSASALSRTSVAGQVKFTGSDKPQGLLILLDSLNKGQTAFGRVRADGAFNVGRMNGGTGIMPGRYAIRLTNTEELYIKSLAVSGADYSSGVLDLREGASVTLSIAVARGLTKLDGVALNGNRPYSGAMVLLVPKNPESNLVIPRDQSDSDGTFTLPNVQPGSYLLVAIDNSKDLAYQEPGVLNPYLARAEPVEIPLIAGSPVQVNVQKRLP